MSGRIYGPHCSNKKCTLNTAVSVMQLRDSFYTQKDVSTWFTEQTSDIAFPVTKESIICPADIFGLIGCLKNVLKCVVFQCF